MAFGAATLNRSGELGDRPSEPFEDEVSTSLSTVAEAELEPPLPAHLPPALFPTVEPTLAPTVSVVEAASARISQQGGSLTESEAISVLRASGWPEELIPAALRVAWCESKYSAATGDSGNSVGWFQLGKSRPGWQGWFLYFGVDESLAFDFLTNARVAWQVYQYEQALGYRQFANWSCRP